MSKRFDNEDQRNKRRRFCGTCKCKLLCLAIILLLGLGIYFVMPSAPSVTVGNVYTPKNAQGLLINGNPAADYSTMMLLTNPIKQVSYEFAINITIYSPSYIDIGFRKVNVTVTVFNVDNSQRQQWQCYSKLVGKQHLNPS